MGEKKRIFIADDDEAVVKSLAKMLELSGFEVQITQDSKEVIAKVKLFKPHLLLLDLLMPHLGGFEICEMLNKEEESKGVPIIIISALRGYTDIKRAYQLGVVGYVTKPYDFTRLLEKINNIINTRE